MVRITAPLEVSCEYYNDLSALSLPEPMVNIPSMLPAAYLPPRPVSTELMLMNICLYQNFSVWLIKHEDSKEQSNHFLAYEK